MTKSSLAKIFFSLLLLGAITASPVKAIQDTYPKLANYYVKYFDNITSSEFEQLKKWDLLVIQNEVSLKKAQFINSLKASDPNKVILAYTVPSIAADWPTGLYKPVEAANLLMKDSSGEKIKAWDKAYVINITNPAWYNIHFPFIEKKLAEAKWDGLFYDIVEPDIARFTHNGIDISGDGIADSPQQVKQEWQRGTAAIMKETRERFPNKIVIINGTSVPSYQPNINGRMFETFPAPWEGSPQWQATMYPYLRRLPAENRQPNIYIINTNTQNSGNKNDFRRMRFGLTSTLLGDGYFSFDYGDQAHEQLWWYDEYDLKLGHPETSYFNLLNPNNDFVKAGVWRRDFENGVSIVNSTTTDQLYIFKREEFEKIKGVQDPNINSGAKINYIKLAPSDGIILRKIKHDVIGQVFNNGDFARVFDSFGNQLRNGFFAYKADVVSNTRILLDDLDSDTRLDRIVEKEGKLLVSRPGKATVAIAPFGPSFKGRLSFAAYDFNKDGEKEIFVAPASGGGPQVLSFSLDGKRIAPGFFVYDKHFRGGVNLTAGDVNNDGEAELVVSPLKDMAPIVKIITSKGKPISSFLAYDKNFRGGVNLAIGDVDGDGKNELLTGAASGGPHVRVFTSSGALKAQFMAFDPSGRTGVRVMVADTNGDGKKEIIAMTANF